jgi:tetratricopeptide (TPR) repeat protein
LSRQKTNRSPKAEETLQKSAAGRLRRFPVGLALVLLLTLLAYLPALHGQLIWDDNDNINQPQLQSLRGLYQIWIDPGATAQYYPLLHTAFWLEHKLWGNSLLGFHLVTLLWHAVAVSLVYAILIRLKIPGPLLAAAIFAVHPVMVESVAWMCEQKNTLSAVFYLGSIYAYLGFDESRRPAPYFVALALFALGLMTKTAIVTLPAALLVIFWWRRGTISWNRDVLPLAPFFLVAAAGGLVTMWVERTFIGAAGGEFELSFLQRFLLAGRALWFYVGKLFWPSNLALMYPRWTIDPGDWWQWVFPIAAIATTVALWVIRKLSRAPLAAWLYFVGTLLPVLGFVNVYFFMYSFVADHFQYLASVSIIILAAAGIALGIARLSEPARRIGFAGSILLVAMLAALSWRQSQMYANSIVLYQATLKQNPGCWMAHNNLGIELAARRDHQAALDHFRTALRIRPNYAEAHHNLGLLLSNSGHLPEAIKQLQAALAIKPDYPDALNNLGIALLKAGRLPESIDKLQSARALAPDDPVTLCNLGSALLEGGQFSQAVEHLEYAVRLKPDYFGAHSSLARALAKTGRLPQAINEFQAALALLPNNTAARDGLVEAYNKQAIALAGSAKTKEAIEQLQKALQLNANDINAHNSLGRLFLAEGNAPKAIEHLEQAATLQPNIADIHYQLAKAFASAHRPEEALVAAQKGIDLAKSSGQQALAQEIEAWLKGARAADELHK